MIIRAKSCKDINKIATENTIYHRFVCVHHIEMHLVIFLYWFLWLAKLKKGRFAQANSTETG